MLQHDYPNAAFLLVTNESHTVREFFRPLESDNYRGDYSKARKKIGWEPRTKFGELVKIVLESDTKKLEANQS